MHIEGKHLFLKIPSQNELTLIKYIWCDEKTMEAVGGIVDYSEEQMRQWYRKLIKGTDIYFLIFNLRNKCMGEISIHRLNSETHEGEFNIKIMHRYRNRGYALEAMGLFIDYLREYTDVYSLRDEVRRTNMGAKILLEHMCFVKVSENSKTAVYRKIIKNQEC